MADSKRLGLPYLEAAQAQKHVTVNEGLARLDALVNLTLKSVSETVPPTLVEEGDAYAVPVGAVNDWAGQEGKVATFSNGGWEFATPQEGWRAFVADTAARSLFHGGAWRAHAVARAPGGAQLGMRVIEFDHVIAAGATSQTSVNIPANAMVFGLTGRVMDAITGTLADWSVGVGGSPTQFGSGLGTGAASWMRGMLGSPTTYYSAMPLLLTANGGDFAGGTVRFALHVLELGLPDA
ncbi:DUF2793 domain-containing protein [Pseudoruegeria sp. SHC-113]|uniref:DUF2793 domain-containing protein n=1 Tax=Pseudoruegeria sp. SHC-113 TaxID=2855439 RepID=UPI0021BAD348|nr:DUF2793 domain-containing protein [Pseudoruegeria sp. SHC-113]MCT8160130.1 DUF2793 domain-containing protein [Pseudoruegeria sp. SHC-113]